MNIKPHLLRPRRCAVVTLLFIIVAVCASISLAHGGEDHGEKPVAAVSVGGAALAHVAHAGDWEIVVKHPPVAPDAETGARVFVSRFDTNEPIAGARVVVTLTGADSAPVEVAAIPADALPGMYEAKLPALPEGAYQLAARVEHGGQNVTAEFGALRIASPAPVADAGAGSPWARTILIALGLLVGLGLAATFLYRIMRAARRGRTQREVAA